MSYNPATAPQEPKKDYRKLIYGLFIVALAGTWGYIIYDKSKSTETTQQLQAQVTTVDSSNGQLQEEFNETLARLDSLTGSHIKLQGALEQKNKEIQKLKSNISGILRKKNATAAELADAKKMIDELNGKVQYLYAEIEKLKGEKLQLTASNQQLTTEKSQLQDTLVKAVVLKENITDIASTLHASDINIEAIKLRSNGREKETTTAKRADLMRITFDLDANRITPSGTKDLFVCVTGPDGNAISNGGIISTREEGDKKYTSKVTVNYKQGKLQPVNIDWKNPNGKYQPGDYRVQIYENGFKIGESTIALRKGGLFS